MALSSYGVLSGRVVATHREGGSDTPHYQVHLVDDAGRDYRIAINVQSQQSPSELLYLVDDGFSHPVTAALPAAGSGWTPLPPSARNGGLTANLDYIRGNLFDPAAMRLLPADASGPDNDLADVIDHSLVRATGNQDVIAYAFGERWGPEATTKDKIFGFKPGNGVHDIHMNQGNTGAFTRDDGVWQDGGLLLHLTGEDRWVAIFLAFQSQGWHTDDSTGHTLTDVPQPRPEPGAVPVRILAALVNPIGPAPERETVTVLNASPAAVDLTGWALSDRVDHRCPVPAQTLPAGATTNIVLSDGVVLGNKGGAITLLAPDGRKVHGVSYTADQARAEGWTLTF